jgi:cholinesterase
MAERPIIMTVHGPVMGVKKTSALGIDYYNFQKIPYAKPPIGDLKFKSPVLPEPWAKTIDCTTEGPACYHFSPMLQKILGEEDCLHMNVYTKNVRELLFVGKIRRLIM